MVYSVVFCWFWLVLFCVVKLLVTTAEVKVILTCLSGHVYCENGPETYACIMD